ncbi:MAG: U32 family peptidase [Prevotella sp.]|nr:U32 family peptidase [Prevotella sp.]
MRTLELLAPARDYACGVAAVDCGADAVYIGAERFGARAAAGNTISDIARLIEYAHKFRVKVYATLNTIIYDNETDDVSQMIKQLDKAGIDAILVQDLALLPLTAGTGVPLHASTQTDIRSAEDVLMLRALGFTRVVLGREMSLEEIRAVNAACPDVEIECFVHGALCTSYSGACYASQYFFSRSANRGECAQFCRMKFDLIDGGGEVIKAGLYLLSLKDFALINHLEELADAGVCSFKIEGRLKGDGYVKNVVSAYSQRLDELCRRRSGEYARSSIGRTEYAFTPDLAKTFNRGYTTYFFAGRKPNTGSFNTPKVTGESVGIVKKIEGRCIIISGFTTLSNGDGVCFFDKNNELKGFRVNRAEGTRIFPLVMPKGLKTGMTLYRNRDAAFDKLLSKRVATRRIPVKLTYSATPDGFSLAAETEREEGVKTAISFAHTIATKPQSDNIRTLLSRWGNTIYKAVEINIEDEAAQYFISPAALSELRHDLARLLDERYKAYKPARDKLPPPAGASVAALNPAYKPKNVANSLAAEVYKEAGFGGYNVAPEVDPSAFNCPLMQCKHCIRYALGYCTKHGGAVPTWREPLFLRFGNNRRVRLEFDCKACRMDVKQV